MAHTLDEKCEFKVLYRSSKSVKEKKRSGTLLTNFHAITFRPRMGTLTSEQIRLMIQQVKDDCGPSGPAYRATIGIENAHGWHVHIALILKKKQVSHPNKASVRANYTYSRYFDLLDGTYKNEFKTENTDNAIHIYQPGAAVEATITQRSFLAYPLKHLADDSKGGSIEPEIDGTPKVAILNVGEEPTQLYYSIGLFDGLKGEELKTEKRLFSKAIQLKWIKKMMHLKNVVMDGSNEFWGKVVPAFCAKQNMIMAKDRSNWPDIVAKMWQYDGLDNKYYLQVKWFGYQNLKDLGLIIEQEEKYEHIVDTIACKIEDFNERREKRKKKRKRTCEDSQSTATQSSQLAHVNLQLATAQSTIEELEDQLEQRNKDLAQRTQSLKNAMGELIELRRIHRNSIHN